MRCLEKDPKNRIQTVGELARMLAPYASDPLSAQQSAERATRILTGNARNSNLSLSSVSVGSGGMGLTPAPALTPHSWNRTGGSSVGGAAGQMGTKVTRSSRSLVIAGVATLIVAAGAGGFVIANNMGKSEISHVGAPNPLEETMSNDKAVAKPDPVPVKAIDTAPKPDLKPDPGAAMGTAIKSDPTTKAAPKTDATPKTDTKTATKTDATNTKTTTTKTDPTKAVAKTSPSKTDTPKSSSKTTPAKTTKTKPKDDGLFDDRH